MSKYNDIYRLSIDKPEEFWAKEAAKLHWFKEPKKILDDSRKPFFRWFVDGKTNLCYNAVDRHVKGGKADKPALIWESPETNKSKIYTFKDLYNEVNACAAALKELGLKKGDRSIIYMPMIPEAIISMLACVRIGVIHSVVFAGFSVESLAERIDDAKPKLIITSDAVSRKGKIIELKPIIDKAIDAAKEKVSNVLVYDRGLAKFNKVEGRDIDWNGYVTPMMGKEIPCEEMDSSDPSYILFTSGTTGKPKGVVRDTGGYMVALHTSMELVYGVGENDVYWSTSDIGWVVGHSYIVYGPLLKGVPTIVFEGTPDYPEPDIWWKIVEKHGVTVMFSAPTAFRMLKKFPQEWIDKHDLSTLKYFFLAGEPLDEPTYQWATKALKKIVIDHYWQTETGWAILSNMAGIEILPIKPGSPTKAVVGFSLDVVDDSGKSVPKGQKGYLVIKPPLPPGTLSTIWEDDERYIESYWRRFKNTLLYNSGDYAIEDSDGYFWMLGRSDEVINIAGHRLGTREVEEAVSSHPHVVEASAIGVADELKGQAIAVFVVLKPGFKASDEETKSIKQVVREKIGAIATPRDVSFVKGLPKTRSGKVMRRVLKALTEGKQLGDLSTIEDGASVDEIRSAIEQM